MPFSALTARSDRMDAEAAQRVDDGMVLMFVHRGSLPFAFETNQLLVQEGHIALYWAAIPRLLLGPAGALCTTVSIPLDRFLAWRLPEDLVMRILEGGPSRGLMGDIEGMAALKWEEDLASDDPFIRRAAELEVQACTLRMARKSALMIPMPGEPAIWRQAAAHILARLEDDLSVAEIARAIGRHPSHLMRIFKQETGFTLHEFILNHRMARAKRLLLERSIPVGEVAMRAGFGSERRFFEIFRQKAGCTPRAYRMARTEAPSEG